MARATFATFETARGLCSLLNASQMHMTNIQGERVQWLLGFEEGII